MFIAASLAIFAPVFNVLGRESAALGAPPFLKRNVTYHDKDQLDDNENGQRLKRRFGEAIAMQAHAEHVGAEPTPACDDIAENSQAHESALPDEAPPAGVEDEGV